MAVSSTPRQPAKHKAPGANQASIKSFLTPRASSGILSSSPVSLASPSVALKRQVIAVVPGQDRRATQSQAKPVNTITQGSSLARSSPTPATPHKSPLSQTLPPTSEAGSDTGIVASGQHIQKPAAVSHTSALGSHPTDLLSELSDDDDSDDDLAMPVARPAARKAALPTRSAKNLKFDYSSEEDLPARRTAHYKRVVLSPKTHDKRKVTRLGDDKENNVEAPVKKEEPIDFSLKTLLKERQSRLDEVALFDRVEQEPELQLRGAGELMAETADEEAAKRLETLMRIPKQQQASVGHRPFLTSASNSNVLATLREEVATWRAQLPDCLALKTTEDVQRFATNSTLASFTRLSSQDLPMELRQLMLAMLCASDNAREVTTLRSNLAALMHGETLCVEDIRQALDQMGNAPLDLGTTSQSQSQSMPFSWSHVRQLASLIRLASIRPVEAASMQALLPIVLDEHYAHLLTAELETLLCNFLLDGQVFDEEHLRLLCPTLPLQVTLLEAIPTSSRHACIEIQRLACVFLQSSRRAAQQTPIASVLEVLNTQAPFQPLNAATDYTVLSSALDVLSLALLHLEDPFTPSLDKKGSVAAVTLPIAGHDQACSPYIAQLLEVCEVLQRKHARIVDSKAALVYRSEAKSKIQRLSARLRYQLEGLAIACEAGFERA